MAKTRFLNERGKRQDLTPPIVTPPIGPRRSDPADLRHGRRDGTPRKLMDVELINAAGWKASTPLVDRLRVAYSEFVR